MPWIRQLQFIFGRCGFLNFEWCLKSRLLIHYYTYECCAWHTIKTIVDEEKFKAPHALTHSLTLSLRSLTRSLTSPLTQRLAHSLTKTPLPLTHHHSRRLTHSRRPTHSLTKTHSHSHSLTSRLTHHEDSLTHSLTETPTKTPSHSLAQSHSLPSTHALSLTHSLAKTISPRLTKTHEDSRGLTHPSSQPRPLTKTHLFVKPHSRRLTREDSHVPIHSLPPSLRPSLCIGLETEACYLVLFFVLFVFFCGRWRRRCALRFRLLAPGFRFSGSLAVVRVWWLCAILCLRPEFSPWSGTACKHKLPGSPRFIVVVVVVVVVVALLLLLLLWLLLLLLLCCCCCCC